MAQSKDGEGRNGLVERRRRKEWPSRAKAKKEILDGLIFRLEKSEMAKEGKLLTEYIKQHQGERGQTFSQICCLARATCFSQSGCFSAGPTHN